MSFWLLTSTFKSPSTTKMDEHEDFLNKLWASCGHWQSREHVGLTVGGRYRVIDYLNAGGMGQVYVAEDTDLLADPEYPRRAIKFVRPDRLNENSKQELLREAGVLSQLVGVVEGVLAIHSVGEHDGQVYFVTELVHGVESKKTGLLCRDLETLVRDRGGKLTPREAAEIVHRCSVALDAIHRLQRAGRSPLVHRDIKPSNVLLSADESDNTLGFRTKLADFGLAMSIDQAGNVAGTLGYMAPEQFEPDANISQAADIWSLGAMLFRLVEGELPPDLCASTFQDLRGRFTEMRETGKPIKVASFGDSDLTEICRKCLQLDPKRRYRVAGTPEQSVSTDSEPQRRLHSELSEALGLWLANQSLRPPYGSTHLARRAWLFFGRRNAVATVVSMLLIVSTVAALWINEVALRAREEAAKTALFSGRTIARSGDAGEGVLWAARSLGLAPKRAEKIEAQARRFIGLSAMATYPLDQAFQHPGPVRAAAFSPDERLLVSACGDRKVRIWNVQLGDFHALNYGADVRDVAVSTEGRLATGTSDGELRFWNMESGDPIGKSIAVPSSIHALAFSPNGQLIAAACQDGRVRVWRVSSGRLAATFADDDAEFTDDRSDGTKVLPPLYAVAFSADGKFIAFGGQGQQIRLFDVARKRRLFSGSLAADIHSIAPHPNQPLFAVAVFTGSVFVVDAAMENNSNTVYPPVEFKFGRTVLNSVAWSPEGSQFAAGGDNSAAVIMDLETQQKKGAPLRSQQNITDIAFSRSHVATCSRDGSIRIWGTADRGRATTPIEHPTEGPGDGAAAISSSGTLAVCSSTRQSATNDKKTTEIVVSDGRSGKELNRFSVPTGLQCIMFSWDEKMLLTGCNDGVLRVFDLESGSTLHEQAAHGTAITAIDSLKAEAATGGNDHVVRRWDLHTAQQIGNDIATTGAVHAVSYSPDGKMIAIACEGADVRLWETGSNKFQFKLDGLTSDPLFVSFSPNSRYAAVGLQNGSVLIWDLIGRATIELKYDAVPSFARFSPDGLFLVTGYEDTTIMFWDTISGVSLSPPIFGESFQFQRGVAFSGTELQIVGRNRISKWMIPGAVMGNAETVQLHVEVQSGTALMILDS
ncbi:MAG: protein kinase [Pirellulales bacterium]